MSEALQAKVDGAAIVRAARKYVGTPFMHQGRMVGIGIDCVGLVTCVQYDLGLDDLRLGAYNRQPDEDKFRAALLQYLDQVQFAALQLGDILTFRFVAEQHLAFVSSLSPLSIIHAYEKVGRCIEQPVDSVWMRRLRGCYRFRGVWS